MSILTLASSLSTSARIALSLWPVWMRTGSPTCRPIRCTGLRAWRASCGISEISEPRTSRMALAPSANRSLPRNIAVPAATRMRSGRSPIRDFAVTVLPLPDSPISPTISRAPMRRETSSTIEHASARPRESSMVRPSMRRTSPPAGWASCMTVLLIELGVEQVAQPVAQNVETEDAQKQRHAGGDADPGRLFDEAAAGADHVAP